MRESFFLFLYGILTLTCLFLTVFWRRMTRERINSIDHPWFQDRYTIFTGSITFLAAGLGLIYATAGIGLVLYGPSPTILRLTVIPIVAGLVLILAGATGMVWLADLQRIPPNYRWLKIGTAIAAAWALLSCAIPRIF